MPITFNNTNDTGKLATVKAYSPKFFSSHLTGSGKTIGILNQFLNPAALTYKPVTTSEHIDCKKEHYQNGDTKVNKIPVNPILRRTWQNMTRLKIHPTATMTKMAEKFSSPSGKTPLKTEVWTCIQPHSIVMEETEASSNGNNNNGNQTPSVKSKRVTVCYQIFVYTVNDSTDAMANCLGRSEFHKLATMPYNTAIKTGPNHVAYEFICNVVDKYAEIFTEFESAGYMLDRQAVVDYLNNYSIYDAMVKRSEEWQSTIHETLAPVFENLGQHMVPKGYVYQKADANGNMIVPPQAIVELLTVMFAQMEFLEDYPIPLDIYRDIYASIKKNFQPSLAEEFYKHNLNLLLSNTLNNLNINKPNLTQLVLPPNPKPPVMNGGATYSPQQARAVSCTDPLILVQSGAGTGKALPLDEPVLTPSGWAKMGDLNVGDEVIGSNGKPCKIIRIHEQGEKPGYELLFHDGASIRCCGEHQWDVRTLTRNGEVSKIMTTEEWLASDYHKQRGYIPVVQPVQFPETHLPIDPYFLGAMLARGYNGHYEPGENAYSKLKREKAEQAVCDAVIESAAKSGFTFDENTRFNTNGWEFRHSTDKKHKNEVLRQVLRDIGAIDYNTRRIPAMYLTASVEQRTALLNGIYDNIGTIRESHKHAELCINERLNKAGLVNDVLQLLWSLGIAATKKYAYQRWYIDILSEHDPFLHSSYRGQHLSTRNPFLRRLWSAKPIDPVPMRCIEVDSPDHLYVAKDFIVTHNSSVILGRVDWMINNGVDPKDIMIISFTNAAADNIMAKNPYVQSMTIAKMIHTIYNLNFPGHELSTAETLSNTIDIYFPNDPFANQFCKRVRDMENKRNNDVAAGYTKMNNFVEAHLQDVLRILDGVHQTTLELEIIICYQMISQLKEPPEIQSRFLIIDEVQDNSVFEFIYALRYCEKHKEALFIVGKLRLPTLNPTNCGKTHNKHVHHRAA